MVAVEVLGVDDLLPVDAPPPRVTQRAIRPTVIHVVTAHASAASGESSNSPPVSISPPVMVPENSPEENLGQPSPEVPMNGSGTSRRRRTSGSAVYNIEPLHVFETRPAFKRSECTQMDTLKPMGRSWSVLQGMYALFTSPRHAYSSTFLEMDSPQTHAHRKRSARRTYVAKSTVQLLNSIPCYDYKLEVCVLSYWLTQHSVLGLWQNDSQYRKQAAVESFMEDVAGQWCYPEGDLLLCPRKNPDLALEFMVSLKDVISGLLAAHELEGSYNTGLDITDEEDPDFNVLKVNCCLRTTRTPKMPSVFKPLFHPVYFKLANRYSSLKAIVALDLLQKGCVIFIQICDMAVVAKDHVKALLLAQCLHTCTHVMDVVIQRETTLLEPMAYTHFMTHYLLANRYYEFMMACTDYKQDHADYKRAKENLKHFFGALEGFQNDLPFSLKSDVTRSRVTLPSIDAISEKSTEHFTKLHQELPPSWQRSAFRCYHAATLHQLMKMQDICWDLMKPGNIMIPEMYDALQTVDERLSEITVGDSSHQRIGKSEDIYVLNKFLAARCCKYKAMFRFPSDTIEQLVSDKSSPVESGAGAEAVVVTGATNSASISLASPDEEDPSTSSSRLAEPGPSRVHPVPTAALDNRPLIDASSGTSTPSGEMVEAELSAEPKDYTSYSFESDDSPEFSEPCFTPSTGITEPRSDAPSGIATPSVPSGYFPPKRFDCPMEQDQLNNFIAMERYQMSALEVFRPPSDSLTKAAHIEARKQFLLDQIIFLLELEYRGVKDEKNVLCPITSLTLALRHAMAVWEIHPLMQASKVSVSTLFKMDDSCEDQSAFDEMMAAYCAALSVLFLLKSCKERLAHKKEDWQRCATYYHQVTALFMQQESVPVFLIQLFADYVDLVGHCYRSVTSASSSKAAVGTEGNSAASETSIRSLPAALRGVKRQLCLLRRMMPLLPVLWEYSVTLDLEGPIDYGHVMVEEMVLPFGIVEREKTLASIDDNILNKVEKEMAGRNLGIHEASNRFMKSHGQEYLEMTPDHRKVMEGLTKVLLILPVNFISSPDDVSPSVVRVSNSATEILGEFFKVPEVKKNPLRSGTLEEWHQRAIFACDNLVRILMSFVENEQDSTSSPEELLNFGAISTTVAIVSSVLALLHSDATKDTEDLRRHFPVLVIATLVAENEFDVDGIMHLLGECDGSRDAETVRNLFSVSKNKDRIPGSGLKPSNAFIADIKEDIKALLRSAEKIEFSKINSHQTGLKKSFKNLLLSLDCFNEAEMYSFSLHDIMKAVAESLVRQLTGVYYKTECAHCFTSEHTVHLEMDLQSRKRGILVSPLRQLFLARYDKKNLTDQDSDNRFMHLQSPGNSVPRGSTISIGSVDDCLNQHRVSSPTPPPKPPRYSLLLSTERDLEQFHGEDERNCDRCDFFSMSETIKEVFGDLSCRPKRKDVPAILAGVRRSLLTSLSELLDTQQQVMGHRVGESVVEEGLKAILLDTPLFNRLTQLKVFLESRNLLDAFAVAHVLYELDKLLFGKMHSEVLRGKSPLEGYF